MRPVATLRPAQEQALAYRSGRLAIAAAPGAGKTFILTRLIVRLIADLGVRPDEILVLTYMRSAALHFRQRVAAELARRGQTARGLRAMTLHAFCQSILQRHAQTYETLETAGEERDEPPSPAPETESGLRILSDAEQRIALAAAFHAAIASGVASKDLQKSLATKEPSEVMADTMAAARKALSAAKQAGRDPRAIVLDDAPEIGFMARHYEEHLVAG
ncbi:MAG: UvrD-helicase domain-containing protein, partial [Cyanobacteria bacterium REEB65]|nr:UvrD-helicase domain-containing protein [Cyanobacteria bacterium REEB65]